MQYALEELAQFPEEHDRARVLHDGGAGSRELSHGGDDKLGPFL
jgi:hypothetical protein